MNADKHLQFIIGKIEEIGVALFQCHVNSILKIPTNVINTLRVDEEGNIFIFMNRPQQQLSQFEREFPVSLNYFKKGKNYFVNVFGKARIIYDPEELYSFKLSAEEMNMALHSEMLIKVKIYKADYYEKDTVKRDSVLLKIKSFVYSLLALVDQEERSYDFSTSRSLHGYGF